MKRASIQKVAAIAFLLCGCNNNHNLGAVDSGPPPSDDASTPPPDGNRPVLDAGMDAVGPPAGPGWTGYIENYHFMSGSDAVRIVFVSSPEGQVMGTVILGSGTPPPPPTDPNVGYPPGYGPAEPLGSSAGYVAEGYAYTMRNGRVTGQRLQFGVSLAELWRDWCALQTPIPGSDVCVPNWGAGSTGGSGGCYLINPSTHETVPVDCGKLSLCSSGKPVCVCDASACRVDDEYIDMNFDLTINGTLADGSVSTGHNVHLTQDP